MGLPSESPLILPFKIRRSALLHISKSRFRAALQSNDLQKLIHDFLIDERPDKDINTTLDEIENILTTAAKRCLKIKIIRKRHIKISNKKLGLIKNVVLKDLN